MYLNRIWITHSDLILLFEKLLSSRGVEKEVSSGWWESFCQRDPNITLRTPASLSKSRAMATNEEVIDQYFNTMEEALIKKFIR